MPWWRGSSTVRSRVSVRGVGGRQREGQVRSPVVEEVGSPEGVLIVDDTQFAKKGTRTAEDARNTTGRPTNRRSRPPSRQRATRPRLNHYRRTLSSPLPTAGASHPHHTRPHPHSACHAPHSHCQPKSFHRNILRWNEANGLNVGRKAVEPTRGRFLPKDEDPSSRHRDQSLPNVAFALDPSSECLCGVADGCG